MNTLNDYKEYCKNLKIKECRIDNLRDFLEYNKRLERLVK